ncbi:hypothetical protein TZ03_08915 [Pseudomonas sp. 10-1B]|nr:hypothetical protein TZ03_08915 [Pseudomonas sp. 10-1B]
MPVLLVQLRKKLRLGYQPSTQKWQCNARTQPMQVMIHQRHRLALLLDPSPRHQLQESLFSP